MKQGRQRLAGGYAFHAMEVVMAAIEAYRIGVIRSIKKERRGVEFSFFGIFMLPQPMIVVR